MKFVTFVALLSMMVMACADPVAVGTTPSTPDTGNGPGLLPIDALSPEEDAGDAVSDTADGNDTIDSITLPDIIPEPDVTPDASPDIEVDTSQDTTDTVNTDCGDNNKCTIDLFDDELGECVYYPVGCFDGLACTLDMCDPETGCTFPLDLEQPNCCVSDEDCDDDDGCTIDACEDTGCVHVVDPNPACCYANEDCDDGDACTEDICGETGCSHLPIGAPSCCETHADCNDNDPCTWDQCTASGCTYQNQCCTGDDDCPQPDDVCANAQCLDGACVQVLSEEDESCCTPGVLWDAVAQPPVLTENTSAHGWSAVSEEGSLSWTYSSTEDWSLLTAAPHDTSFTLGPMALPGGVISTVSFDLLPILQMEAGIDHLILSVGSEESGFHPIWSKEELVESGWQTLTFSLTAWAGQTVSIKLDFASVTADGSSTDSITLQDVNVSSECAPMTCDENACDDGIATTWEMCVEGLCAVSPSLGVCSPLGEDCPGGSLCTTHPCEQLFCTEKVTPDCCEIDEDCDDGNPCTADFCGTLSENVCTHNTDPDCCVNDGDCEDGDPCTKDFCHPTSGCLTTWSESCCQEDLECDDGDPCTEDSCQSGACVQEPNCCVQDIDCVYEDQPCLMGTCNAGTCTPAVELGPNCCGQEIFSAPLESLSAFQNWAVIADSNEADDVKWTLQSQFVQSPPYALYYGDPNKWSYDTGAKGNLGTIESPPFYASPGQPVWVTFDLYLANEFASGGFSNADFDRLLVDVVSPGKESVSIWKSSDMTPQWWNASDEGTPEGPQWTTIGPLLLPEDPSGTWRLRFTFDTIDGSANQHVGPIIDDITVHQACDLSLP